MAHYLIHSYDFPPIASKGDGRGPAYAGIAPSAPHALHMPSHIFARLGYWPGSSTKGRSAAAAKDELRQAKLEAGSYNELHAMDDLVKAAMHLGRDREARAVLDVKNQAAARPSTPRVRGDRR